MPEYERFQVAHERHVARVTLRTRTMDAAFFAELPTVFTQLERDPDVRAIVLTGAGAQFSYGLDLPGMSREFGRLLDRPDARTRHSFLAHLRQLQAAMTTVASSRTPIVAATSGHCIGGGLDLLACTDIRVASHQSVFSLREARMAIVADLGSLQRLSGIIADGHLRELALTAGDFDANHAARIGLVNYVTDSHSATLEMAHNIAVQIASNPPLTILGVKEVLDEERAERIARGLRYVAAWNSAFLPSDDLGEALSAFTDVRQPKFSGS